MTTRQFKLKAHGLASLIGLVFTAVSSSYMYYFKAPSVAAVRPELTEVGFWTAAFSGRFMEYLYMTRPLQGLVLSLVLFMITANAVAWGTYNG